MVNVDVSIGASSEQRVSVRGPLQGHAPWNSALWHGLGGELVQDVLVFQVPDLDGRISSSAQPVILRGEAHSVDRRVGVQRVQMLTVIYVPEHSSAVLTTGTAQRSIRRDGDGVKHTSVSGEVRLQLAVIQVPDLDQFIPTTRDDQGVLGGRRKSDAGDPVSVVFFDNGVFALSEGVPKLDGFISGTGNNLTIVSGEGDGVHVLGMSLKQSNGSSRVQVPQSHGVIHRSGQGELSIRTDDGVAYGLVVAPQASSSISGRLQIFGGQFPNHSGFIPRSGNNQVGLFIGGRDGGNPSGVALEGSTILDVSHI